MTVSNLEVGDGRLGTWESISDRYMVIYRPPCLWVYHQRQHDRPSDEQLADEEKKEVGRPFPARTKGVHGLLPQPNVVRRSPHCLDLPPSPSQPTKMNHNHRDP